VVSEINLEGEKREGGVEEKAGGKRGEQFSNYWVKKREVLRGSYFKIEYRRVGDLHDFWGRRPLLNALTE